MERNMIAFTIMSRNLELKLHSAKFDEKQKSTSLHVIGFDASRMLYNQY